MRRGRAPAAKPSRIGQGPAVRVHSHRLRASTRRCGLRAAALVVALLAGCGAPADEAHDLREHVPPSGPASQFAPLLAAALTVPEPLSPFAMAKAETLLRNRLPCLGCHTLGNEGGRIGPDLTGLGARTSHAYVVAVIRDPEGMLPGTIMPKVDLPPRTAELIAAYLIQREGQPTEAVRVPPPPRAPPPFPETRTPEALYAAYCAACHGPTGDGDGRNAPYLPNRPTAHADSAAMSQRPDDTLFDGIHAGARILGGSHRMPPFGESLTDSEIRGLVAYIRELCRCQGPAWSRDDGRSGS